MNRTADRILIVDDTSASLKLLATILTKAGYTVFPADSGELALETVHLCKPDLIFLDINMPGMNGFEVLKHLKDNPETSLIPVIMISSADEIENQLKCFQLGAVDFVIKPFIGEILLARVNTHLELARFRNDLSESNAQLTTSALQKQAILDNLPMMAWLKDTESRLQMVNKFYAKACGFSVQECIGKTDMELFPKELAERYIEDDRIVMASGAKLEGEELITSPLGLRSHLYYKTPIFDSQGAISGTVGVAQDITERKRAEEERQILEQKFQQTQKLESLGVLAGGIAHDFNNILAIIVGYCSLTKMDYKQAEKHIPEIEKAAERAAALCRQMLTYAGKAQISMTQVNMCMLVDEMVNMLKTTIPQNTVIKPELSSNIPFITADASQLRQIVMNLIINASEAIVKEQGEIRVLLDKATVSACQPEKDYYGQEISPGSYVCLEVTDTGCGMDEETKWRIFEPFYTTKFTGRGLGMSAVLGIINAHNGALQLESRLGHGTTFRVYLPVQLGKSESEEAQPITASAPWQGSGTILLAEDEVQVKSIATILLKEMGFTVLDAANGKEALELYLQNAADITLVVTDMGMPVMNGYDLFYKLKQLNPQLPIIITSGFGEGDISSKIPSEEIAGMINKPYNFDQLREVVRGVVKAGL